MSHRSVQPFIKRLQPLLLGKWRAPCFCSSPLSDLNGTVRGFCNVMWAPKTTMSTMKSFPYDVTKHTQRNTDPPLHNQLCNPQAGDLERELEKYRKINADSRKGSGLWGYISGANS